MWAENESLDGGLEGKWCGATKVEFLCTARESAKNKF